MGEILYFSNGKLMKGKKTTLDLLNETRTNKEGRQYLLFDCQGDREQSLRFIAETLDNMRREIQGLCSRKNADLIDEHFEETLRRLSAIRIDQSGKNEYPMKLIFDEFTKGGTIPFEAKARDGVTRSVLDDGIMMLMPELKQECESQQGFSARHTLVHEMLHAMSNQTKEENGRLSYVPGMQIYGSGNVFDDLNEGLNEYYTQKILQRMYPGTEIEDRYAARTSVIEAFMQQMDEETQTKIFDAYISGNFDRVLNEQFSSIRTQSGESLKQRLEALYQMGFRIGAMPDEQNMQNARSLIDGFKEFDFRSSRTRQSEE